MGELLESMEPIKPLRRGEVVEGIIMRADSDGIFVNIGHKSEGIVPPGEMRTMAPQELKSLQVGDEIATFVVRPETAEQGAILSVDKAIGEQGWLYLQKALESGTTIEGRVMGFNRGGAIVEVEGVQGFVPMSQLVSVPRERFREIQRAAEAPTETRADEQQTDESQAVAAQQEPVVEAPSEAAVDGQQTDESQEVSAQQEPVAEATPEAAVDEQQTDESQEAAAEQEPVAEATPEAAVDEQQTDESQEAAAEQEPVAEATPEAAVDEQQTQASQEVATAQKEPAHDAIDSILQMKVLEVNRGRNRAIFSERAAIQELRNEQKARLIQELTEGEVRSGKVTGISSFGAFVDLGGADGLIHISELSWNQVSSPEAVVKIGDELDVYILRVDAENRKIALSLRRLQPEPWETVNDRYQVGDIVDATVTKLTNFGAFARVKTR